MIIVHLGTFAFWDLESVREPQAEVSGNEGVDLYCELRDICEEDSEDRRASDPFLASQLQRYITVNKLRTYRQLGGHLRIADIS